MAREALRSMQVALKRSDLGPHDPIRLTLPDASAEIVVPKAVLDLLSRVLANMANGQGVTLVPAHAELTTQQAADMLNVSRPFLIGLVDSGEIEHRLVGTHRRVKADSVMRYMRRDDAQRVAAADELAVLAEEMGLA
jgi:excisionase family DNA binding protein